MNELWEVINERFSIQIVAKTTVNCSLLQHPPHKGISYDDIEEYGENVELILIDQKTGYQTKFRHINHMSDTQLYDFILEQIEEILEEE